VTGDCGKSFEDAAAGAVMDGTSAYGVASKLGYRLRELKLNKVWGTLALGARCGEG